MASANVTLAGDSRKDFEVDGTQRTATLRKFGGSVTNMGTLAIVINVENATITTVTEPLDDGSELLNVGDTVDLPFCCKSFSFKAAGSTYLKYTPQGHG